MDFTLDDHTHAQVLKLRHFIKNELQPLEDEVEAKGVLDSKTAIEIFEKHFKGVKNYGNATTIDETKLPNFDLLVGGFPCQAFSVAGKLRGFDDTRGTLFFDIARILSHKKPKHFILENVRGLLSHGSGRTFQKIIEVLTDLGYLVEWEVLNSKNYGVPQNRERVYIIGHLRGSSRPKVFPIRQGEGIFESSRKEEREGSGEVSSTITSNYKRGVHAMGEQYIMEPRAITKNQSQSYRVFRCDGVPRTLIANGGGVEAKTGLYEIKDREVPNAKIYDDYNSKMRSDNLAGTLTRNSGSKAPRNGQKVVLYKTKDKYEVMVNPQIRRLTPLECERLQGFPDNWTEGLSDTQRYKCIGNAVTTTVIREVVNRLYPNI